MAKNIQINIATSASTYEPLYPQTSYSNMIDTLSILSTTGSLPLSRLAEKVSTARVVTGQFITTIDINLADSWSKNNDSRFQNLMMFPEEKRIPDMIFIYNLSEGTYTETLGMLFGLRTNYTTYDNNNIYRFGIAIEYASKSSSYKETKSCRLCSYNRVYQDGTTSIINAPSNGVYFGPLRGDWTGSTYLRSLDLGFARTGSQYKFFGFYFS